VEETVQWCRERKTRARVKEEMNGKSLISKQKYVYLKIDTI